MSVGMEIEEFFRVLQIYMPIQGEEPKGSMLNLMETDEILDESNRQYMSKEEKILSLLRKKKPKIFKEERFLELVKPDLERTLKAVEKHIVSKMEADFLEECTSMGKDQVAACETLRGKLHGLIDLRPVMKSRAMYLLKVVCRKEISAAVEVTYDGETMYMPVGGKFNRRLEGLRKIRGERGDYLYIANFRPWFSQFYVKSFVVDYIGNVYGASKDMKEFLNHRVIGRIFDLILPGIALDETELSCKELAMEDYRFWEKQKEASCKGVHAKDWCILYKLILHNWMPQIASDCEKLSIYTVFKILQYIKSDYDDRKAIARTEKEISGEYARSYQTKKNIPEKCIRAMRRSGFNQYFGYVEFDEECDLNLMKELYKEFQAFAETIGLGRYPEVSLRFRKLGNHKASGLYYPEVKCLCVDVRCPSSMVHEVGHMIDYHLDGISGSSDFTKTRDRYEQLLEEYIRTGEAAETAILKGKTKYNKDYYLQSTEIFARAFEMYLVRVVKMDNSLCKPSEGFAYPQDEELQNLIMAFFDALFQNATKKGEKHDGVA